MKKEFEITISNEAFRDKNLINWKAVKYHTEYATIDEIMDILKSGYCICSVFKNDEITQKEKTQNNFKETSIIYFDIDETKYKMSDYISLISLKPTICYTTRNNGIKGNRFRLLYFVSTPIKSINEYKQIYNSIASSLENDTNEIIKDKSSRSGVLNISGNAQRNIEYNITYKVYNSHDLKDIKYNPCQTEIKATDNINNHEYFINTEFKKDYSNLSFDELIQKYNNTYKVITNTPIKFNNGYALLDEKYIELKHLFDANNGTIRKRKDGEQRRKHLYIEGLIIRKIKTNISFDELLYNIIYNSLAYYNNSDNQLNKKTLLQIAQYAYNAEIQINTIEKRKFKVDKTYCREHNLTANQYKQIIKKKLNDESIKKWYDPQKSVKDNLKFAKENNIKVSERKLYQYQKEYVKKTQMQIKNNTNISTEKTSVIATNKTYIKPINTIIESVYFPYSNNDISSIYGKQYSEIIELRKSS